MQKKSYFKSNYQKYIQLYKTVVDQGFWIPGLGMALVSYMQLFILCDIDSHLSDAVCLIAYSHFEEKKHSKMTRFFCFQNEKLMLKFNDVPWFLMSKKNQIIYAHLLKGLQNSPVIRIGPFDKLNLDTFANVINQVN